MHDVTMFNTTLAPMPDLTPSARVGILVVRQGTETGDRLWHHRCPEKQTDRGRNHGAQPIAIRVPEADARNGLPRRAIARTPEVESPFLPNQIF